MLNRVSHLIATAALMFTTTAANASAQEVRVGGPPPEIRALVDAVVAALNSRQASAWEAMAQERFAPEYLKKSTPEERRRIHEKFRADFGVVTFERATREGPDAPLTLQLAGAKGTGVNVTLDIVDASGGPRIANLTIAPRQEGGQPDGLPAPPIRGGMSRDELASALDAYLTGLASQDLLSGVVLIARAGEPVYEKGFNFADRSRRVANAQAMRFNIGSINKAFTETAIAQLVAAGRVQLTDTLGKFLPDYPQEVTRAATVSQLLEHTAGVADFFGPAFSSAAKDRFR
jgi:hypothetical protein